MAQPTLTRRRLLLQGLATGLLLIAKPSLSAGLGLRTWQSVDLDWFDTSRARQVPVRLYLPMDSASRKVPLVIFSHGMGGSRAGYRYLGQHWASNGFATLHVQHIGSDRSLWSDGSPLAVVNRLRRAAQEDEAVSRVLDLRFALDSLLGHVLGDVIDSEQIAIAGHSYGANTALLAVGARVDRDGRSLQFQDSRIKAAIMISAPPFYGERSAQQILASVHVPTLHITSTGDVIRIPGYFSAAEDRIGVFEAVRSSRKWLAVFKGGTHSMFTDRSGTGGPLLNTQVKEATRELTTAFLQSVYRGEVLQLGDWSERHAGILDRLTERRL